MKNSFFFSPILIVSVESINPDSQSVFFPVRMKRTLNERRKVMKMSYMSRFRTRNPHSPTMEAGHGSPRCKTRREGDGTAAIHDVVYGRPIVETIWVYRVILHLDADSNRICFSTGGYDYQNTNIKVTNLCQSWWINLSLLLVLDFDINPMYRDSDQ